MPPHLGLRRSQIRPRPRNGSQILSNRDQLRQARVRRVCSAPSSVQQPRDADQVSNRLSREGARHLSKEQPSRRRVKRGLTLLVRTRSWATKRYGTFTTTSSPSLSSSNRSSECPVQGPHSQKPVCG